MIDDDGRSSNYQNASRLVKRSVNNARVKPRFYKLMGQIMNYHIEVKNIN
jgi:hypothetical protein